MFLILFIIFVLLSFKQAEASDNKKIPLCDDIRVFQAYGDFYECFENLVNMQIPSKYYGLDNENGKNEVLFSNNHFHNIPIKLYPTDKREYRSKRDILSGINVENVIQSSQVESDSDEQSLQSTSTFEPELSLNFDDMENIDQSTENPPNQQLSFDQSIENGPDHQQNVDHLRSHQIASEHYIDQNNLGLSLYGESQEASGTQSLMHGQSQYQFGQPSHYRQNQQYIDQLPVLGLNKQIIDQSPMDGQSQQHIGQSQIYGQSQQHIGQSPMYDQSQQYIAQSPMYGQSQQYIDQLSMDGQKQPNFAQSPMYTESRQHIGQSPMYGQRQQYIGQLPMFGQSQQYFGKSPMYGQSQHHIAELPTYGQSQQHINQSPMHGQSQQYIDQLPMLGQSQQYFGKSPMYGKSQYHIGQSPMYGQSQQYIGQLPMFGQSQPHIAQSAEYGQSQQHFDQTPMHGQSFEQQPPFVWSESALQEPLRQEYSQEEAVSENDELNKEHSDFSPLSLPSIESQQNMNGLINYCSLDSSIYEFEEVAETCCYNNTDDQEVRETIPEFILFTDLAIDSYKQFVTNKGPLCILDARYKIKQCVLDIVADLPRSFGIRRESREKAVLLKRCSLNHAGNYCTYYPDVLEYVGYLFDDVLGRCRTRNFITVNQAGPDEVGELASPPAVPDAAFLDTAAAFVKKSQSAASAEPSLASTTGILLLSILSLLVLSVLYTLARDCGATCRRRAHNQREIISMGEVNQACQQC